MYYSVNGTVELKTNHVSYVAPHVFSMVIIHIRLMNNILLRIIMIIAKITLVNHYEDIDSKIKDTLLLLIAFSWLYLSI